MDLMPKLRVKHQNRDLRNSSWSDKISWNYRRNHRGKTESILDKENPYLQARTKYNIIKSRQLEKKGKYSPKESRRKDK